MSNRPASAGNTPAADEKATPRSQKNAITRQYVYDRNVVQIKRSPSRIKRVSVAVVLNNAVAPDGKAWTPEQIAKVESILQSGIGMDEAREDQLNVSALDFQTAKTETPLPWWKQPENMMTMGGYAGYALLALLIFLLVLRPLIKILRQWVAAQNPQTAAAAIDPSTITAAVFRARRLAPSGMRTPNWLSMFLMDWLVYLAWLPSPVPFKPTTMP